MYLTALKIDKIRQSHEGCSLCLGRYMWNCPIPDQYEDSPIANGGGIYISFGLKIFLLNKLMNWSASNIMCCVLDQP